MLYRWHKKIDKNEYRTDSLNTRKKLPIRQIRKRKDVYLNKDNDEWTFYTVKVDNNSIDFFPYNINMWDEKTKNNFENIKYRRRRRL